VGGRLAAECLGPCTRRPKHSAAKRRQCRRCGFAEGKEAPTECRGAWPPTRSYRQWEPADKPGSVVGNHSSGTAVTGGLLRPTRKHRGPRHRFPIWSCSGWGFPCRSVLPPARCALTAPFHPYQFPGGIFSVALSVGSRPPGITWHPALWSPDFPPCFAAERLPGRLPAFIVSQLG